MIMKKPRYVLLLLIGMIILVACSSTQPSATPPPVDVIQTSPPTETTIAETSIEKTPFATETSIILPTENVADERSTPPTEVPTHELVNYIFADVHSVAVSGGEGAYQFSVEIRSPDTGCEQYADWWEVISQDGELIYRRILAHSHVTEQPFTRSGGPAAISPDEVVIVRAHMNNGGYGGIAFQGSVETGFEAIQLESDFAEGLEKADPLPSGCGF
jgi:hypothetical protein